MTNPSDNLKSNFCKTGAVWLGGLALRCRAAFSALPIRPLQRYGSLNVEALERRVVLSSQSLVYVDTQVGLQDEFGDANEVVSAGALQAPLLSSPTDGIVTSTTTPTFQWSSVNGATTYRILISLNKSSLPTGSSEWGGGILINEVVTTNSFTAMAGKLSPGTTYYWEVRAGSSSAGSVWSAIRRFETPVPSLSAPVLSGPADGASAQSTTPNFRWAKVDGATRYRILVATDQSLLPSGSAEQGAGLVIDELVGDVSSYTPQVGKLSPGKTYYWVVRAGNPSTGTGSPWSSVRSFDTIPAGLPSPVLSGPVDGASGLSTTPTFRWSDVAGATTYRVLVSTSLSTLPTGSANPGAGLVINAEVTNGTSYTPPAGLLSIGTSYYWEVRAGNPITGAGGVWSSVHRFDTVPASLATPDLYGPAEGAIGQSTTPAFQWSAVSGATTYRLLVSTSPSMLSTGSAEPGPGLLINAEVTNGTSFTPAAGTLKHGVTYYWQVRAGNPSTAAGSPWSAKHRFTTESSNADFSDGFDYPVAPPNASGWLDKQNFGVNNHLGEDWNFGSGDDDLGLPVFAAANGIVMYARDTGIDGWKGVVIIRHTGNFQVPGGGIVSEVESMYAHLDVTRINLWVRDGDYVMRGQQIGVVGPTPAGSSAPHLHFELRTTVGLGLGPGYSADRSGRTDPSEFIDANRTVAGPAPGLVPPIQISADSISPSSILIDWVGVSGASDYRLYRSNSPDGPWDHQIYFGPASQYNDTNDVVAHLAPGTTYYYRVASVNNGTTSELSAVIAGATLLSAPPCVTNLDATQIASNAIEVTWDDVIATGDYFLERSYLPDDGFRQIAVLSADVTRYVDTGPQILPNVRHFYRIRAVSAGISSQNCAPASVLVANGYQQVPAQSTPIPTLAVDSLDDVAKVYQWSWSNRRFELISDAALSQVEWNKQSIFLTHGWNDRLDLNDSSDFMVMFAQDFERGRTEKQREQFNIFAVDWWDGGSTRGADPNNIRDVAGDAYAGQLLSDSRLSAENGIRAAKSLANKLVAAKILPENVMLIGHSNGAGFMASLAKAIHAAMPGQKIDELVALDAPLQTASYSETESAAQSVNRISNYYQPLYRVLRTIDVESLNLGWNWNSSASFGGPMFSSQNNITNYELSSEISDETLFSGLPGHSQVPLRYSQTADLWPHNAPWGFQASQFVNGSSSWNSGYIWVETGPIVNDSGAGYFSLSLSQDASGIFTHIHNLRMAIDDALLTGLGSVWDAGIRVHEEIQLSGFNSSVYFIPGFPVPVIRGTANSPVYAATDVRVPVNAVLLRFSLTVLDSGNAGDVLHVAFGDQVLGTIDLAEHLRSGAPVLEYWASAFAGQTTQLRFLMPSATSSSAEFLLSNIAFGLADPVDRRGPVPTVSHAPAITQPGDSVYELQVTYTDDTAVNVSTFSSGDISVISPGGYEQVAVYLRSDSQDNGSPRTATYRILAPGGSWDASDNGVYLIRSQSYGVADIGNNWAAEGVIGAITVAISASDSAPPIATLTSAPNVYDATLQAYEFQVTYTDDTAIDLDSLRGSNIFVDAPGTPGNGWITSYQGVNSAEDGSPRIVTYRMHLPGGNWDPSDNGIYTIRMMPNEVRDLNGNYVAATTLGTFTVNVAADTAAPTYFTSLPDAAMVSSGPTEIWFHFSEPMDQLGYLSSLTTLSAEHLGLGGAGVGGARATSASWVGTSSVRFTIEGDWSTGQVLYWFAGYPRDLAGNLAVGGIRSFTIDHVAPTISTSIVEWAALNDGPSEILFYFSEAMRQSVPFFSRTAEPSEASGALMLGPQSLVLTGPGVGTAFVSSAAWVSDRIAKFTIGGTWGSGSVSYWFADHPQDLAGNYAASPIRSFLIDDAPPQAWMSVIPSLTEPASHWDFTVGFWDNVGLDLWSQDLYDVVVTGPHGFIQNPQLISTINASDAAYSIATFRVTPSEGLWNSRLNGTYFISINPNQVFDAAGNAVAGMPLGSFEIDLANAAPTIVPQTFVLSTSAKLGTVVGAVTSSDVDGPGRTYELLGGNGALAINAQTGVITVANQKLLVVGTTTLTVRVTDGGSPSLSADAAVTFVIRKSNTPPAFTLNDAAGAAVLVKSNKATLLIAESAPGSPTQNGALVGTLGVSDVDEPGASFAVTMTDKSGAFAFDPATGRIFVADASKLNLEKTSSFTLTFKTTDHGLAGLPKGVTTTFTVTIKLVDVNEAPTFPATAAAFRIKENNSTSATVGTVTATDPDKTAPNKTLSYSLVSQVDQSDNAVGVFAIADPRSGKITVPAAGALNFEAAQSYTLVVRATDGAGLFTDKVVAVTVVDVNEAPTVALLDASQNPTTTLTIAENAAAGSFVGYLRITNPDVFRAEMFKVSLSDQSGALVAGPYDAATGLVAITVSTDPKKAAKLDFEKFKLGRFVLTAVVTDSGFISNDGSKQGAKSSAKATFAVQLTDVGGA